MPWTWVKPADPRILEGRPLLDLGVGDAQTLRALVGDAHRTGVLAIDRSADALRAARLAGVTNLVRAGAERLPLKRGTVATALAGDLFHHMPDDVLLATLEEIARVLRPGGRLVAWWYQRSFDPSPDAPRFPRPLQTVTARAREAGIELRPLRLETAVAGSPTIGAVGRLLG